MANRHLSRSVALQSLFEWDFMSETATITDNYGGLAASIEVNIAEFAPGLEDARFTKSLATGVVEHREKLDTVIEKFAPDWPIDQISIVDRNVLRLGLFELLFGDTKEVPAKVAINEAIELAKMFGGESSGKFVNGVLGSVYREMGEPGKDDVPAKKRRVKERDIDPKDLPIEKLGGAVVYSRERGTIRLALVHDVFGYWTLSKGHIEEGENAEEGTIREIHEELSLPITIVGALGGNEYIASHPEKGKIRKQVDYFLGETKDRGKLKLTKEGGLDQAAWFTLEELGDLRIYDDIIPIITKGIQIILAKP